MSGYLTTKRFGRWDARVTLGKLGLVVEFYDMNRGSEGRIVKDYYVKTLLTDEYGPSIDQCDALSLYASSKDLVIKQPQLSEIAYWLWDVQLRTGAI